MFTIIAMVFDMVSAILFYVYTIPSPLYTQRNMRKPAIAVSLALFINHYRTNKNKPVNG